ncbi:ankyrin repeat domain-containing protein [Oligoflexaceae bacterium]|nr:ankyrin repeat domain-containing protein [Oligoflexaceae bacterium]
MKVAALIVVIFSFAVLLAGYFLSQQSVQDLIVGSSCDTTVLPKKLVKNYLYRVADIIPETRTVSGENLLQFTLAGYGDDHCDNQAVLEVASWLIEDQKVKVLHFSDTGLTPLHDAVLAHTPEIVDFLLSHGARVDVKTSRMFGNLKKMDSLELNEFLQEKNQDIDRSDLQTILLKKR